MLKKLIVAALFTASAAFAGPCCKMADTNGSKACDVNATKCKHKDCKCGDKCKCGENCKCDQKKACDCNETKKMKKCKHACDVNKTK